MTALLGANLAIVTGGNGGIGRAICNRFLAMGADVVSLDLRHRDWPEDMGTVSRLDVDLSDEAAVNSCFANILDQHGKIDCLINNAGDYNVPRRPFWEIGLAEWQRIVGVNTDMVFLCAKAAANSMMARQAGRIVNVASNVVTFGMPNLMHYVAAKAAVIGMTRAMASELGPFGITVNAVSPGLVPTVASRRSASQAIFDYAIQKQRLKHPLSVDDIAAAISYFCLPESRSITGQTLLVNGGDGFSGI